MQLRQPTNPLRYAGLGSLNDGQLVPRQIDPGVIRRPAFSEETAMSSTLVRGKFVIAKITVSASADVV